MSTARQILPGVSLTPRLLETALGPVEYDLTDGDGAVVLASHGGLGGVDQARLTLNWLDPAQYRLLSVSRSGYLGTPLASGQSFEAQADLFAALLDALGIEQVAVVMLSAGGPPGYQFAIRHPDRVWALVSIDSVSGYYTMPETAGVVTQTIVMSSAGMKLMQWIGQKKPVWLLREMLQGVGYYNAQQLQSQVDFTLRTQEALDFARGLIGTMNPYQPRLAGNANDMALFRQLKHVPVEQIGCPCLIIHGTHDADVKFYHGVYAYEHISGAERCWIEDGSHLGFWMSPGAAAAQAAARAFLARHQPQAQTTTAAGAAAER